MMSPKSDPSNLEGMEDPTLSPLFPSTGEDTSSSNSSSLDSGSPRNDWSISTSSWSQFPSSKSDRLDLSMSLDFPSSLSQDDWSSMEMDADISAFISSSQQFSIDPNVLHFDGNVYNAPQDQLIDSMFQYTVSQPLDTPPELLQLPTPAPASASSRSVSPASSKSDNDASAGVDPNDLNLFSQLSQKARDAVGMKLAVPVENNFKQASEGQPPITPVSPILTDAQISQAQGKVAIPRLRPGTTSGPHLTHSLPASPQDSASAAAMTKSGRPKTSHTTIERRYRTNLNARILALRRAVPALRILEKNSPTQTQGKGLTGATAPKWDFDDVVNERGYVDGVKAAKKNSKGVVLGKAVEYIKALKRREIRLKREAEGLRALLGGLVGGAELLCEWEKEWRERFGGEEADEVEEDGDDNEDGIEADGDEGDEGEDGDSDDEDGRAKKRSRIEKKERKTKTSSAPQAEKRKRGRPKKTPATDAPTMPPAPAPHLILQPPHVIDQRQQPSTYLLAMFVLFNIFNPSSKTPASTSTNMHEGVVLTSMQPETAVSTGWTVLQMVNMLVSVLLLISLLAAYIPKRLIRFLPSALLFNSPPSRTVDQSVSTRETAISQPIASGDEEALRVALGADGSLISVVKCVLRKSLRSMKWALHLQRAQKLRSRREEIELRGWRRLSQIEVLQGEQAPLLLRIQTYFTFSSRLSDPSPSDNITLALLAYPFARMTATDLWKKAQGYDSPTCSEALVLEMEITEAIKTLSMLQTPSSNSNSVDASGEDKFSPVSRIAAQLVLARTKTLAAHQFVNSVSGSGIIDLDSESTTVGESASKISPRDTEIEAKTIVAVGKELGGRLGQLTSLLDKIDRCSATEVLASLPPFEFESENDDEESSSEAGSGCSSSDAQSEDAVKDTRLLLLATVLFRQIFPPAGDVDVLSPPPTPLSPSSKHGELQLMLRRALASDAFDACPETEDARDRVVDILAMRRGRSAMAHLY